MTLDINSPVVYTKQGVPISVNSIAQVKISPCVSPSFPLPFRLTMLTFCVPM